MPFAPSEEAVLSGSVVTEFGSIGVGHAISEPPVKLPEDCDSMLLEVPVCGVLGSLGCGWLLITSRLATEGAFASVFLMPTPESEEYVCANAGVNALIAAVATKHTASFSSFIRISFLEVIRLYYRKVRAASPQVQYALRKKCTS